MGASRSNLSLISIVEPALTPTTSRTKSITYIDKHHASNHYNGVHVNFIEKVTTT